MDISTSEIRKFLIQANRNGYGNEGVKEVDQPDGSHTISYTDGLWLFNDNFFGGEPFGGREVISFDSKPVWMMVYYGRATSPHRIEETYAFLRKALLSFPDDRPYRGPSVLVEGGWRYDNKTEGDFNNFSGIEIIYFNGIGIYEARYSGGLVDK